MPEIFLSYSREDQVIARRYAEALEHEGFEVWWDVTLRSGEAYDRVTEKALREAKAVVVLWSRQSVDSNWVRAEATIALRNETLMPVMIELCERPIMFELTHTADLSHWAGDVNAKDWRIYVADVRRLIEKDAPQLPAAAPSPSPARGTRSVRSTRNFAIVAPLVLLIASGALYAFLHLHGAHSAAPPPAAEAKSRSNQAGTADVSLAVLPFADMSPEHNQEYFSDGLSEELLDQLAQIKALRVAGRTSSFSFKGKNEDLRVIAEKLGVNHLLEGSVRKDGNQLRITAQLINAADGSHLWSTSYDREMRDVFAVQEEIAKDVAKALSITLDVGDMPRALGGTTNVEAYDRYLQARTLTLQGGPVQVERATQYLREAVTLDPNFAAAWFGLYMALTNPSRTSLEGSAQRSAEMADVRARLMASAPESPGSQYLIALEQMEQLRWKEAEAPALAAEKSLWTGSTLNLGSAAYMNLLVSVGRTTDALQRNDRALKLEPLSLAVSCAQQMLLDYSGRSAEAQVEYLRTRNLPGDHTTCDYLALFRLRARNDATPAQIRAQFATLLEHDPAPHRPLGRILFGLLGNAEAARAEIRKAAKDSANEDGVYDVEIMLYADAFDDRDLALAKLHRNVLEEKGNSAFLWFPFRTGLRADPRFKQIVRELKLVDYWRSSGKWADFCHPVGADDFECR